MNGGNNNNSADAAGDVGDDVAIMTIIYYDGDDDVSTLRKETNVTFILPILDFLLDSLSQYVE